MIASALIFLVAALHLYFLVLEMFLWTKPTGLRTFRMSLQKAKDSAVLAANQLAQSELVFHDDSVHVHIEDVVEVVLREVVL
jgi:uncharacterized membrane protein